MNPTAQIYREFQEAYDFFNQELFEELLPNCLITVQRKKRTRGYFSKDRWEKRETAVQLTDEIALNPEYFDRTVPEILSTLVHEMVHLWQRHHGKPGRNRYHNREWARKMGWLGLCPSNTGKPGGKQTGDRVSHYIMTDGTFDKAQKKLLSSGYTITWVDRYPENEDVEKPEKTRNKTKYTCPKCGLNAWAKPDISLLCGDCTPNCPYGVELIA